MARAGTHKQPHRSMSDAVTTMGPVLGRRGSTNFTMHQSIMRRCINFSLLRLFFFASRVHYRFVRCLRWVTDLRESDLYVSQCARAFSDRFPRYRETRTRNSTNHPSREFGGTQIAALRSIPFSGGPRERAVRECCSTGSCRVERNTKEVRSCLSVF